MNCQECREELAAYIEGLLDETHQGQMEAHWPSVQSARRNFKRCKN